jgi:hypothetical protein
MVLDRAKSKPYFMHWNTITDVISFVMSLQAPIRVGFLIVMSGVCWALWKHRNVIVLNNTVHTSSRNLIHLILSLVQYWSGQFPERLKQMVQYWFPESLDTIPIQMVALIPMLTNEGTEFVV